MGTDLGGHGIEGAGKVTDFVVAYRAQADIVTAGGDLACRFGQIVQGLEYDALKTDGYGTDKQKENHAAADQHQTREVR